MNAQELKDKYYELYDYMAHSKDPKNMMAFGSTMNEMMDWLIANKPDAAEEWIQKLEAIRWKNYLTPKEAEAIVASMEPKAPWNRQQWAQVMDEHHYDKEKMPCYNRCALWVTMNMIMSDSSATLAKYINGGDIFQVVHDLALDKLMDKDGRFDVRSYFSL